MKASVPINCTGRILPCFEELQRAAITWALTSQTSGTLRKNCAGKDHTIYQVIAQTQEVVSVPEAPAKTRVEVPDAGCRGRA